jgi:hypothetical protein
LSAIFVVTATSRGFVTVSIFSTPSCSSGSAYAKAPKAHSRRHIAPAAIPGFRLWDIESINFYISIINKKGSILRPKTFSFRKGLAKDSNYYTYFTRVQGPRMKNI